MSHLDLLLNDGRTAVRSIVKNSGTTALAVISIALGIGLTTALFSGIDAFVFRPFSFVHPEEVYTVSSRADDQRIISYGWPDFEEMTRAAAGLGEVVAYERRGFSLAGEEGSEIAITYVCTPHFFSMLGVGASLGRAALEAQSDGRPQVVLGHQLWMRRFGGDPGIVRRTIRLNSTAVVVAGVMSPDFSGLIRGVPCDIWVGADAWYEATGDRSARTSRDGQFEILARLPAAEARGAVAKKLDAAIRGPGGRKPAPPGSTGTWLQPFTFTWQQKLVLGGAMLPVFGLLLLVACANAAQLRLAQTEARRKEMGVRLALGSSASGLARLLLIETLLVSAAGAASGLFLASYSIDLLSSIISTVAGLHLGLAIDWRVGAFTLATAVFASLLAGLAPVRYALRLDVVDILKSDAGTARAKNRLQRLLVAGQTAASVVFFGFALLFAMSLRHAAAIRPGFDPEKSMVVMAASPALPMALLAGGAWSARSALLGVAPLDPLAYVGCAGAAIVVALLATWLPARRATKVNPIVALRAE